MSFMDDLEFSPAVARRYLLGRQGLWPGRRWAGRRGTARALHAMEALQLDPLHILARSHDLTLHSRVADYQPAYLDDLLYRKREFFDAGGTLEVRPMRELPYWRVVMRRKTSAGRWGAYAAQNAEAIAAARAALRAAGRPLSNRDFAGQPRINDYRGRKPSALALYWLWLAGEIVTHHRENFERWYGNFDDAQIERMKVISDALPANPRLVLNDRVRRQNAFITLLTGLMDKSLARAEAEARLAILITELEQGRSAEYQAYAANYLARSQAMTVEIANLATPEQRATAQRRFKRWADDMANLAARKEP